MSHAAVDQVESHDIVVIGASAGGVETLQRLVSALAPELPFAFLIVLHIAPHGSHMPAILTRAGSYEAAHPQDGDPLAHGRIIVAPPDLHLLIEGGVIRLDAASGMTARGPRSTRSSRAPPPSSGRGSSGSSCPAASTTAPPVLRP